MLLSCMTRSLGLVALAICAAPFALAQTDAERARMEYERQQREYWRQQEEQRQAQQRQQQIYDEQRRRDEEASRNGFRMGGGTAGQASNEPPPTSGAGSAGGAQAAAAVGKLRRDLEKQPPLPADRNQLLGRWRLDTATRRSANALEQLMQPLGAGTCAMVFGTGVWEFRPQQLVNSDGGTPDMVIAAQYRGNAQSVAVLPKEFVQLMVFEFIAPDRVREKVASAASGDIARCEFVRVGAPVDTAVAAPTPVRSSRPSDAVCSQTLLDKLGKVGVNQVRAMSDVRFKEPAIEGKVPNSNHLRIDLRGSACDDARLKATLYDFDADGMLQSITYVWDRPAGPAPAPIFVERVKTLSLNHPGLPPPQVPGRLQADTSLGRLVLQDMPERNLLLEAYAAKR